MKQVGKAAAFCIGLGFVTLQTLSYCGYVEVKWTKVLKDIEQGLDQGDIHTHTVTYHTIQYNTIPSHTIPYHTIRILSLKQLLHAVLKLLFILYICMFVSEYVYTCM